MKSRTTILFALLAVAVVVLFVADLAIGSTSIALDEVWAALTGGECDGATRDIVLKIRLIKAVMAVLAGAALAVSGLQMQTLFRNPLAGPYVLGVSSGASLFKDMMRINFQLSSRHIFVLAWSEKSVSSS